MVRRSIDEYLPNPAEPRCARFETSSSTGECGRMEERMLAVVLAAVLRFRQPPLRTPLPCRGLSAVSEE